MVLEAKTSMSKGPSHNLTTIPFQGSALDSPTTFTFSFLSSLDHNLSAQIIRVYPLGFLKKKKKIKIKKKEKVFHFSVAGSKL